ncbi:hypothetical protein ABKN59_011828 [Abortiporus biennis]
MWADGNKHYFVGELSQLVSSIFVVPLWWYQLEKNGEVFSDVVKVLHHYSTNIKMEYYVHFTSTSPNASSGEQLDALIDDMSDNTWHAAYDCQQDEEVLYRIIPCHLPADNPQQSTTCSHLSLAGNYWCRICKLGGTNKERETNDVYHAHFCYNGPRQQPVETLQEIKSQIEVVALGVQARVSERHTASGVKDPLAEFWIQQLLEKAHQLQQDQVVTEIKETIQHELIQWLYTQPPEKYKQLPQDSVARTSLQPGDYYNSLLTFETLDVHQDTPVEILYTYLLGQDKYAWHYLNSAWNPTQITLFSIRLQSSSTDGLSIPPIHASYICQYCNNLIRKHFKALQQVAFFHLDDSLCSPMVQDLWRVTGNLGAMLWYHEIENMEEYLADIQVLIDNLLDIWSYIDPKCIFVKAKLHLLTHIIPNIRRHGPAILFSTEIFECFNAIFRMCSVLSNHHTPSRDIAWACADMEHFKHLISGGWWRDSSGNLVQASDEIRRHFNDKKIQRRLGYVSKLSKHEPGSSLYHKKTAQCLYWPDTCSTTDINVLDIPQTPNECVNMRWHICHSVIAQSHDQCRVGSWVVMNSTEIMIGRIKQIVQCVTSSALVFVIVESFRLTNSCHPHFHMPTLQ